MANCQRTSDEDLIGPRCPQTGSAGVQVGCQTVKALLTEAALGRFKPGDYRFCADAHCDIVYFAATTFFGTVDLRVPVWQKVSSGSRLLCYCFGESETSIRAEIESAGSSLCVERIREHIAAGRCACEVRNPSGKCCIKDVLAAVGRIQSEHVTS